MKEDLLKIIEHYGVMPQLKYFQSEVFELNEAGRETKSSIGTIHKCCVGKSHTCNGYKWKFVLDKENK